MNKSLMPLGGRSSQAIVDGAMNALRTLVKERLSGKSGGSSYNKQVSKPLEPVEAFTLLMEVMEMKGFYFLLPSSRVAVAARRMWWTSPTTTLMRPS